MIKLLRRHPEIQPASVVSPSGEGGESDMVDQLYSIPIHSVPYNKWDLNTPPPAGLRADLVIICNTMLCSPDPMLWLRHISQVAPLVLIQDLACGRRESTRITSPTTGDRQRYSVSSHGIIGKTDPDVNPVFDLSTCGADVIDAEGYYEIGEGEFGRFVALLDLRPIRPYAEQDEPGHLPPPDLEPMPAAGPGGPPPDVA